VHAHFYQPPRENPWLEAVEVQDSAYPFHDWNERITAECYAPNSASRILDNEAFIQRIVNNYANISFNFGPTLLSWMEARQPETYRAILEADRVSRERFRGHGSAIAQAYNHMIMPLANRRDKRTQVLWGIRDFEHRFGRVPEGMWLPETAVDNETLEVLAEAGIRFTILAPRQAARVRRIGGRRWTELQQVGVDPSRAYLCVLPSGRRINIFFYDGPISQAVAFERLLSNGENFVQRLLAGLSNGRTWPQLVHIATDGESYGHHHPHGDMALAYALNRVASMGSEAASSAPVSGTSSDEPLAVANPVDSGPAAAADETSAHESATSSPKSVAHSTEGQVAHPLVMLTNYGEFLERYPAENQVEVLQKTSWSCYHGVERWMDDCGCNSGRADWRQQWRKPLREALDWLRDELAPRFEQLAGALLHDAWAARDAYIEIVLDRSLANINRFLERHARSPVDPHQRVTVLKLLEIQRHLMLMYTSCAWFFDEISGIETVQVMQYAARALQLAEELFPGVPLEEKFLEMLAEAPSNLAHLGNAAEIYKRWIKPLVVDLRQVAAHYALSCMFLPSEGKTNIFCYEVDPKEFHKVRSGSATLVMGEVNIRSEITTEEASLRFAVLYTGDHDAQAGVAYLRDQTQDFQALLDEFSANFQIGNFSHVLRLMRERFGGPVYSLNSLFSEQRRAIVQSILETTLQESEASYRRIYEKHAPLMRFVAELGAPQPPVFHHTAAFVINQQLRHVLQVAEPDLLQVAMMLEAAKRDQVSLEASALGYDMRLALERMMMRLEAQPDDLLMLQKTVAAVELTRLLPFHVDLWKTQNIYYQLMQKQPPRAHESGEDEAVRRSELLRKLGALLKVRTPEPAAQIHDRSAQGDVENAHVEEAELGTKDGSGHESPPTDTLVA
jgi:alpha-amylase/alpha-mannosidase (GH57 family)